MVWWRKKNEGFEWRDYVRTTILVRREHRRQRLKDVHEAAAAQVKHAGKRGVEVGVSGARNAGAAAWRGGRAAAGKVAAWSGVAGRRTAAATGVAARWMSSSAAALGERAGKPLSPLLSPLLSIVRQPRAKMALAGIAVLTGLGAAYRTWAFGFDTDACLAAVLSAVSVLILAIAHLSDPHRAPARDRESLLTRLGAKHTGLTGRPLPAASLGIAALILVSVSAIAGLWYVLPSSFTTSSTTPATRNEPDPYKLEGRAVAVSGDKLRVAGKLVALDGIEAPEPAQSCARANGNWRCGAAAKEALAGLLRNRRISCDVLDDSGPQKRARCFVQGNDVAEQLVRKGSVFSSGGFLSRYSGLESEAQDEKVGLWSGAADRPQDYRDKRWQDAKKSAPDGCPIKGRIRAGARTYVLPWAPSYESIRLRTSRGERWFCSESEAADAGWSHEAP